MYREYLQKVIGFDKWHLTSLKERYYALPMINRLNELIRNGKISSGVIIEIGCGLGDIISAIQWKERIGYDIDKKAIITARILHPCTSFRVGTFDDIRGKKISVMIALNFMHRIKYEECYKYFRNLLNCNEIDYVIVDAVQSPPYQYAHDYKVMFAKLGYVLEYKSRGYVASGRSNRKILYFRNVKSLPQKYKKESGREIHTK